MKNKSGISDEYVESTARVILKRPYLRVLVSDESGGFTASIPEFPGCFAEGDTAAEAATSLESVAESWLMATLCNGQTVPDPRLEKDEGVGMLWERLTDPAKYARRKARRERDE